MIIQKKKRKKERKKNARTRACFFHQFPELKFVKRIGTACPSWLHIFLVKRNFAQFLCTFHKLIPPKRIHAFLLQIRKRRKLRVSIKLLASKITMAEISRSISCLPLSWARIFHTWCTFLQVHTARCTYSCKCTVHTFKVSRNHTLGFVFTFKRWFFIFCNIERCWALSYKWTRRLLFLWTVTNSMKSQKAQTSKQELIELESDKWVIPRKPNTLTWQNTRITKKAADAKPDTRVCIWSYRNCIRIDLSFGILRQYGASDFKE